MGDGNIAIYLDVMLALEAIIVAAVTTVKKRHCVYHFRI
jgi:hypothetical protein